MSARLTRAAEKGELNAVRVYLNQGDDPNAPDEFGLTALHWAAKRGDAGMLEILLLYRPDLECADRKGKTALLLAAEGGHRSLVETLLNEGADLSATSQGGHTLLHLAAASGNLELVRLVLSLGRTIDPVDNFADTPLTLACTNRAYPIVTLLLEEGANVNHRGNGGNTPLMYAVLDYAAQPPADADALLTDLLQRGSDPNLANDYGWTPLMRAAHAGNLPAMRLLLERSADRSLPDGQGMDAFQWAARGGQRDAMNLLLAQGADPNATDLNGQTTLHQRMRDPKPEVVRWLLERGADPNRRDRYGRTALYDAAIRSEDETVRLLLAHGATLDAQGEQDAPLLEQLIRDRRYTTAQILLEARALPPEELAVLLGFTPQTLNAPDERGWTPLGRAAREGEAEWMRLLLRAQADVNGVGAEGVTPLMLVVSTPCEEAFHLLLAHGADVNRQDSAGVTALMQAAEAQQFGYVAELLKRGAEVNALDHHGRNALSRADKFYDEALKTVLLEAGARLPEPEEPEPLIQRAATITPHWKDRIEGLPTVLPPERSVACPCPKPMECPVLMDRTGLPYHVTACLRCGRVSCVQPLWEEANPRDVRCTGNELIMLPENVQRWLEDFPRLATNPWHETPYLYLPAAFRCNTPEELEAAIRRLAVLELPLSHGERLRRIGIPRRPPPPELPDFLRGFAERWAGLQLTDESPLERLLNYAHFTHAGSPFAREVLLRRTHIETETLGLLRHPQRPRRDVALSLIQDDKLDSPEILAALATLLVSSADAALRQPSSAHLEQLEENEIYGVLDTLLSLGEAAAPIASLLNAVAERVGDQDYYLRKRIEQVYELISKRN